MKKLLYFSLLAVLAHSSAQAACQVFEHADYKGGGKTYDVTTKVAWVGNWWNDRISSINLTDGSKLTVWLHKDFGGESRTFTVGTAYIGDLWNDKISSFICDVPPIPSTYFNDPKIEGFALDVCREWATNCGKPAADAFCHSKGHRDATDFRTGNDAPPTRIINGGQICDRPHCDRITAVWCRN